MIRMTRLLLAFTTLFLASCNSKNDNLTDGLFAEIETSKGTIIAQLEFEKTPVTVANFVSLAEGSNTFVNEKFSKKPFYDGLKYRIFLSYFSFGSGGVIPNCK